MKPVLVLLAATLAMATAPVIADPDDDVCLDKRRAGNEATKRPSLSALRHRVALDEGGRATFAFVGTRLAKTEVDDDYCQGSGSPPPPPPPPIEPPCHLPVCQEN